MESKHPNWTALRKMLDECPYPVPPERKDAWLETVCQIDPKRVEWHIQRAWYFSGTRVGPLVAEMEGDADKFNRCARETLAEMLLVYPPEKPTPAMKRGIALEPMILDMIQEGSWLADMNLDPQKVRVELIDLPGKMIWQKNGVPYAGNPDAVVKLHFDDGRKPVIMVIDAKAPAETEEVPAEAYQLQTDFYRWGMKEAFGIRADLSAIAQLNYQKWQLHVTVNDPTTYAANVHRMQRACEFYHQNYLQQGILPDWPKHEIFDITGEEKEEAEKLAIEFSVYKILSDVIKKFADESKTKLNNLVEGAVLPPKAKILPRESGILQIGGSMKTDEEILDRIWSQHFPGEEFPKKKVTEVVLDYEAAESRLVALGVPDVQWKRFSPRITQPGGKSAIGILLAQEKEGLKNSTEYRALLQKIAQDLENIEEVVVAPRLDSNDPAP